MKVRKEQVLVFPLGKAIKAGAGTGIIILIIEDPIHDHHGDLVNAARIIMVISMAADHPAQISHLMAQNSILMRNTRSATNIGMIMRRMSNRLVVTMRMWGT